MPKKISNSYNSLFRLQSEIKFHYQGHFLHYINQLAPKVSIEIRKLTERCEELFGKFPELINTTKDNSNFYISYPADSDLSPVASVQRNLWNGINNVFIQCIYKKSRENSGHYGWQQILTKFDDELNKANKIQNKYIEIVNTYVSEELNENFDARKLEYADAANIPTKEVTESTLNFWLSRSIYQSLRESDKNYGKAMEVIQAKIEKLKKFQNDFDALLERLCLNKPWLARSIFRAIWNGTGKLQMESTFSEHIPENLIDEIKNRLETKLMFFDTDVEKQAVLVSYPNNIPLPLPFIYKEHYLIYDSFEEYEEKAIKAYRKHLHNYFNVIEESFKKSGYKLQQGNTTKYDGIDWLVLWNYSNFEYLWEIVQQITKFEGIDMNNEISVDKATDIIRKKFEQFEQLDLPIRPWKRNRKK